LVVDRHSNFKLDSLASYNPKLWLFHQVSRWTIRKADATIVTNSVLQAVTQEWGGVGYVLPDRLPELGTGKSWVPESQGRAIVVFIASYDTDEPLEEFLSACRQRPLELSVYVTGNYLRAGYVPQSGDQDIHFTGYLAEEEYVGLLRSADLVAVLTTEENLLNCGSYEAVALGKPMLLSNSTAIQAYFSEGALYVDNTRCGIAAALGDFPSRRADLVAGIARLRKRLVADWDEKFSILSSSVFADRSPGPNAHHVGGPGGRGEQGNSG